MNDLTRDLTESGDYYEGSPAAWAVYRAAVDNADYDTVLWMEEGNDPDFRYAP